MGASGPKEIKAIRFGFSQRLFMAKNNSGRIILKPPQSDESPTLGFSVPTRNGKALRVNVNRGLRVLKITALPPPVAKELRRARVSVLSGLVSGLLLAQNDAHEIVRTSRVIPALHFRRELVVGLRHSAWQGHSRRAPRPEPLTPRPRAASRAALCRTESMLSWALFFPYRWCSHSGFQR